MARGYFFLIAVFLFSIQTFAEAVRDSADVQLEPMIVTATRTSRVPIETPNSIDVITSEQMQIENLSRTVPDALNQTAGVMVQKTSLGQGSPYLRGFTGQQTLFLIDGIRLNNSVFRSGPNQYWNTVDLFTLDHMEVIKGPGSVLYGSDAVGGTVNAITEVPEPGRLTSITPRGYYRFSSAEQSHVARVEARTTLPGNITFSGGVSPKKFGDLMAGGDMGIQEKTGYGEFDGDARLDARFSSSDRITAAYQRVSIDDAWRTHSTIYGTNWMNTQTGSDLERILDQGRQLAYLVYNGVDKGGFAENIALRGS
ncbi:MAG: TonB-dependent receptor plug domain-containing protein, partial [Chitinispirillaceae bacterium]|nr:TonB-dependent receptor plug domain-containing protein [Chitinispirillaceae bacterium]